MRTGFKVLKAAFFAMLAGTMVFALVACGGGSSGSSSASGGESSSAASSSNGGITLQFQQWWAMELPAGTLEGICQDFTDRTGVAIELLNNPHSDTRTLISVGAATRTAPDIVGLDGSWVYDFAKQGAILNLTELMNSTGYDSSQLLRQIQYDGNTYSIPVVNYAYPLCANLGILEEAGVSEIPSTWSEFLAACDLVAKNTSAAGFCIPLSTEGPNGIQNQFMPWLWASGGAMMTEDGYPNLTGNAQLEEVTDFVKQLSDGRYLSTGAAAMKEQDMLNEFENGRLAFMIDGISHLTTISRESPDINFTYAPVPVKDGYAGQSGLLVVDWGIGIASNCKYQDEAWQFVQYMLSPEVNARLAEAANAFPGNANATPDYSANDPRFLRTYEIFQSCYLINEFAGIPTSEDLMRGFNEELIRYFDGEIASAADMLAAVQPKWEAAFR